TTIHATEGGTDSHTQGGHSYRLYHHHRIDARGDPGDLEAIGPYRLHLIPQRADLQLAVGLELVDGRQDLAILEEHPGALPGKTHLAVQFEAAAADGHIGISGAVTDGEGAAGLQQQQGDKQDDTGDESGHGDLEVKGIVPTIPDCL